MKKKIVSKTIRQEYLTIFSRHPSHRVLRNKIPVPVSASIRFGSQTTTVNGKKYKIELNTPKAVECSSDKLYMKTAFEKEGVKTAPWCACIEGAELLLNDEKEYITWKDVESKQVVKTLKFPIVTKHRLGSRGSGNILHQTFKSFQEWLNNKPIERRMNYIIEQYMNYDREYRIHVGSNGQCFYTCRKALKADTAEDKKWFKNDQNSVWFVEENENFFKPKNWEAICAECVKALNAVGLDVAALDVRVQAHTDKKGNIRENPDFFILETNSAPSIAIVTEQKYLEFLPKLINNKIVQ